MDAKRLESCRREAESPKKKKSRKEEEREKEREENVKTRRDSCYVK